MKYFRFGGKLVALEGIKTVQGDLEYGGSYYSEGDLDSEEYKYIILNIDYGLGQLVNLKQYIDIYSSDFGMFINSLSYSYMVYDYLRDNKREKIFDKLYYGFEEIEPKQIINFYNNKLRKKVTELEEKIMKLAYPSKNPVTIDLREFVNPDIKKEEIINEFMNWNGNISRKISYE